MRVPGWSHACPRLRICQQSIGWRDTVIAGDRYLISAPIPHYPWLMLVTEPKPDLAEAVRSAASGGVNLVQFRSKVSNSDSDCKDLLHLLDAVRQSVPVVANCSCNLDILNNYGSSGIHFSEARMSEIPSILQSHPSLLIGCSVHSMKSATIAAQLGASYLIAGTVFESLSHPGGQLIGTAGLHAIAKNVNIPVIAIGGVTPINISQCIAAGASGVAVVSGIMKNNPHHSASNYYSSLMKAWKGNLL